MGFKMFNFKGKGSKVEQTLSKTPKSNGSKVGASKNWIMLVVALVIGGVGIYAANSFIENQLAAYEEKYKTKEKMVQVVVPKKSLPRGMRLKQSDLVVREIPLAYVDKGAVSPNKYKVAVGQRLSFAVEGGRPLLWAHLESGAVPTFSGKLPEGHRALSFSVDKINSISGFLQPRDRIDLMLTYKNSRKKKITRPMIQNLLVIATDKKVQTEKFGNNGSKKASSYKTLTVQVSPEDAEKIILAQDVGTLTAVLRHPDDKKLISSRSMTTARLFSSNTKKRRQVSRSRIEFIIGGS